MSRFAHAIDAACLTGGQKKDCEFYGVYIVLSRQDFISNKPSRVIKCKSSGTSCSGKAIQLNSKSVSSIIYKLSYKLSHEKPSHEPSRGRAAVTKAGRANQRNESMIKSAGISGTVYAHVTGKNGQYQSCGTPNQQRRGSPGASR